MSTNKVVRLENKNKTSQKEFWKDFRALTVRGRAINSGIDKMAPKIFDTIDHALDEKKLSATAAATILTRLLNSAKGIEAQRLSLYREMKKDGYLIPESIEQKQDEQSRKKKQKIQKEAEKRLGQVIQAKLRLKEQEKQA